MKLTEEQLELIEKKLPDVFKIENVINIYEQVRYEFYKCKNENWIYPVEKAIAAVRRSMDGKDKEEVVRLLNILLSHSKTDKSATNAPTYCINLTQKTMNRIAPVLYGNNKCVHPHSKLILAKSRIKCGECGKVLSKIKEKN